MQVLEIANARRIQRVGLGDAQTLTVVFSEPATANTDREASAFQSIEE